ncbi:MAG TPA: nucleoside deaminase [Chloroflexia bacterium]|nr:nucleoside deaminase [Chloroflexia bacterium]
MNSAKVTALDEAMIQKALDVAQAAIEKGEAGVGAVLCWRGEVLATGHNMFEETKDMTLHAEMATLRQASKKIAEMSDEEKQDLAIYVSLEPCLMCFAAISFVGIRKVVFSAYIEDANQEALIARGLTCSELNPLLTKGPLELVEGVKNEAGKRLLAEMGKRRKLNQ